MEKRFTIKEVAAQSGVSFRTVSRVINNDPHVKAETRERVLRVIKETGFEANLLARSLRGKGTNTVLALIEQHEEKYWGIYHTEIIHELIRQAKRKGYHLLISASSARDFHAENDGFNLLRQGLADGVLMFDTKSGDRRIEYLRQHHIPFVILGKDRDFEDTSYVDMDNIYVGEMGVEYLAHKGRRNIIVFLGEQDFIVNQERAEGILRAKALFPEVNVQIKHGITDVQDAYEQARILLGNDHERYDAFFVSGDERAIGVYRAVGEKGLRIPSDISILGVDNIRLSTYLSPPLTTIDQRNTHMAHEAFKILYDQMAHRNFDANRVLLSPWLVERGSA